MSGDRPIAGGEVILDFGRPARIGLDEAVYAAGKTPAQLGAILDRAAERGARLLLTRLDEARLAALPEDRRARIDYDPLSRTGVVGGPPRAEAAARVGVVTAGTSDLPAAREAARTLLYHGEACVEFADVGVAGLWRLVERLEAIRRLPVIIVAAGMDAALPSVLGGLVPGLLIALPTSVGYGVAEGGRAALHAALASCAPGVVVVNVDNGYGAACAALRAVGALAPRPPSSDAPKAG